VVVVVAVAVAVAVELHRRLHQHPQVAVAPAVVVQARRLLLEAAQRVAAAVVYAAVLLLVRAPAQRRSASNLALSLSPRRHPPIESTAQRTAPLPLTTVRRLPPVWCSHRGHPIPQLVRVLLSVCSSRARVCCVRVCAGVCVRARVGEREKESEPYETMRYMHTCLYVQVKGIAST
jgi:hypothetical protein